MDINTLLGGFLPQLPQMTVGSTNVTENNASAPRNNMHNNMHNNIVESILPLVGLRGFAPLYQFIGSWLGWDPTVLLTALGFVWAANKVSQQLYSFVIRLVEEHLMSSIHVSSGDDIYDHLMGWLSCQPKVVNSRDLMAETVSRTTWDDEDESTVARDRSGLYLNFSNQEARMLPQYIPAIGRHTFWWKGQYFRLYRKKESIFKDGSAIFGDKEDLIISCLWRSPTPIKQLLAHAKEHFYDDHEARTIVKRPCPPPRRGRNNWTQVANRPVRDMKTVVLDPEQKLQVLADMNEYLHPATPRWYANRGIPLRRGYLFHGPPGTGKTSLSFALAGVFGLDIHVISLLEPTLTEEDLSGLFSSLPRRCVVLLEDIDTAGLRRPADELQAAEKEKEVSSKDESQTTTNDIKELAKALKKDNDDKKRGISLSGLLNAIDGVASHEGRILIMTTNVPEMLDDALIRPGRVDLQVQFTYATKQQAKELFIRMYEGDQGRPRRANAKSAVNGDPIPDNDDKTSTQSPTSPLSTNGHIVSPETSSSLRSGELDISLEELPEVARQFSEKIPDAEFSPAEIQGYLLKRKKHPRRAVEEADKWVAALVQQKASKTKISQVQ